MGEVSMALGAWRMDEGARGIFKTRYEILNLRRKNGEEEK